MLFKKVQADYVWICKKYVTRMCGQSPEFLKAKAKHIYIYTPD